MRKTLNLKKIIICILSLTLNVCMNCFANEEPCAVHYWEGSNNFGDMLNEDLLNYFSIKFKHSERKSTKYLFIGSILQLNGYINKLNVFGAGFIHPPLESFNFPQAKMESFKFPQGVNAFCLRGEKTKECLKKLTGQNLDHCLLGDPGLLCRDIFPNKEKKLYDVGIIIHEQSKDSPYIKNIKLENKSYTFIDINSPTKEVCKQITQCRFILSSSMHGLIASDSYGIPNHRIITTDSQNPYQTRYNFKFEDYYSIYKNVKVPDAIDLKCSIITDSDIDQLNKEYNIPQSVISDFCKKYTALIKKHFTKRKLKTRIHKF